MALKELKDLKRGDLFRYQETIYKVTMVELDESNGIQWVHCYPAMQLRSSGWCFLGFSSACSERFNPYCTVDTVRINVESLGE